MKSYLINLIFHGVATAVKRISPSTRAAAFMLLIDPLVQQDKSERALRFLFELEKSTHPKRLLIGVPQYDRDWRVPLKDELGVNSRLDRTHFIEYTREKFLEELSLSNLRPTHMEFRWREIWSVAEPLSIVENND